MQDKIPAISVVIPVYNKGELFRKTLASALKQTFTDYEVVVIDDGSTDGAGDVTRSFNDPRVRYFYQANSGLPAVARNSGIRHARAEYIAFLDADDIWYPEKLAKSYNVFKENPHVDLVSNNEIVRDASGKMLHRISYGPEAPDMFRRLLFKGNCLSPSATMIKRSALLDIGLFREDRNLFSVEDYDLWLRLAKRSKFYFLQDELGEFIVSDRNISSRTEEHCNNQIAMLERNFEEHQGKRPGDRLRINARIAYIYLIIARYFASRPEALKACKYILLAILQMLTVNRKGG